MSMRTMLVLGAIILASSSATRGQDQELILSVGGGLPGSRSITVEVLDTGDFSASGVGVPFTDSGPTKFKDHRSLGKSSAERIFWLARQAAAEWRGTGEHAYDCKWVTLDIQGGASPISTGSGCLSRPWFSRPSIKAFLASLDQLLPTGWTVSDVLNH